MKRQREDQPVQVSYPFAYGHVKAPEDISITILSRRDYEQGTGLMYCKVCGVLTKHTHIGGWRNERKLVWVCLNCLWNGVVTLI